VAGGFFERLGPAPVGGGFAMEDWWVWCGSPARDDDGRCHLFASRWPHSLRFFEGYLLRSEVVHATADRPEGPYTFQDVVLPARGGDWWDGKMTHNPTIHRQGDRWLLYYIGSTYPGDIPPDDADLPEGYDRSRQSWRNIRIGLATAPSPDGPWTRLDEPVLRPRPDRWDSLVATNPAPTVREDGTVLMIYRSSGPGTHCNLGLAAAPAPEGPFERVMDEPLFDHDATQHSIEDPYLWWSGERYEVLMKDIFGTFCGELYAGLHATSPDGRRWAWSDPPKAYSRTVRWDDGTVTCQGSLERPQLLLREGQPTHLFAATSDGPGGFRNATRTWTMVIPVGPPTDA